MGAELSSCIFEHHRYFVVLWLHTAVDPPANEWDPIVSVLSESRRARKVPASLIRQLVLSDGGAPNALQRTRYGRDFHDGLPCPLSVVTTSLSNPVKRGIATALRWVNPAVRFFAPSQFQDALVHLGLESERQAVWREYQRLATTMKAVSILDQIETPSGPK